MHGMRTLTAALAGLLAFAGVATAQTPNAGSDCELVTEKVTALCQVGADPLERTYNADAGAASEGASALVDTDASHTHPDNAGESDLFGWLSVRWSAFVARLGEVFGLLGQETPDLGGETSLYVGQDGVHLDAAAPGGLGAGAHVMPQPDEGSVDAYGRVGDALRGEVHGALG